MARKRKNDSKEKEEESGRKKNKKIRLSEETKHSVFAVICIALSFFFVLAAWGKSGVVGSFIYRMLDTLLGVGFFMLPLLLLLLGIAFFRAMRPEIAAMRLTGSALFSLGTRLDRARFSKWIRRTHRKIRFRSPRFTV